jgi:hypothetical protein
LFGWLAGLAICQRLTEGENLRTICASADMPNKATVMRWLHAHADFREQYVVARDIGMDALADEARADAEAPISQSQLRRERHRFPPRPDACPVIHTAG